uniref:uncharacterized protein LOC122607800 n=1 Tax=Erigeron canadensis TaxID=72917 RepID=UPI001CB8AF8D|nr:uncharacterized protein LOC122607800 [Erigeron canadensis]
MEENTCQATRGRASLDKVRKAVNSSVEFHPVTFMPLGDPGTKYTNWVGLKTRTSISILLADWKKVQKVQKDRLWSSIQKHWNIPNDENTLHIKKSTLKIANTSWRNFKKNLIRIYVRTGKTPFSKYKFIKEETWREFCRLKSTREFMVKSAKGKELVKLNKNPHHLGSRGYLGKKDQWAKEKELGKCPELFSLSTERAREFLLARRVKVGPDEYELPENLLPLANQIIEKEHLAPGEDSLVAVMGKDHSGGTRGVSHNVGVRTTLPGLAGKKRKHKDMESLKRTIEDQEKVIKELKVSNVKYVDQQKHMQEQIHAIQSQQPGQSRGLFTRAKNHVKKACVSGKTDTQVYEDANNNNEAPENYVLGSNDGKLNHIDTQNIAEGLGTPHVEHCVEELYNSYDDSVLSFGWPKEPTTIQLGMQLPRKASTSQSGTILVQGYKVKQSVAPILEAIFKKHGDIAAECIFNIASVRASLLEVVCEVVMQIEANDVIEKMEEIESHLTQAEAAKIDVSWLRVHLEAIYNNKRKEVKKKWSLLTETKVNTVLVQKAAQMDLRERSAELVTAQERFKVAERCVRVLHLVEEKLVNILDCKAEKDSWGRQPML